MRITVEQGEIEGIVRSTVGGNEYFSFMGIPYAEPPIGKLRFKVPIPIKKWDGVKDATKEGNVGVQYDEFTNTKIGNEDCLYLNVHTPNLPTDDTKNEALSVVVYIHHGSFIAGSGNSDIFGPDFFIQENVVFVSINYRLGPFGFLCLDVQDAAGNMGLKDQNLALKWVQRNIGAFNGNPKKVTLMGLSAGSASVEYHMLSPLSKGLFSQGIIQSGSCLNPWARNRSPIDLAFKIGRKLGCDANNVDELLSFLQEVDGGDLVKVSNDSPDDESKKRGELVNFTPVIEKRFLDFEPFLEKDPLELLKNGDFSRMPTLNGFSDMEGVVFKLLYGDPIYRLRNEGFLDIVPDHLGGNLTSTNDELMNVYIEDEANENDIANDFLSDLLFVGGIYSSLKFRTKYANQNYLYIFVYDSESNFVKKWYDIKEYGACHIDEITYLATTDIIDEQTLSPTDLLVRKQMTKMWTAFIKYGSPTPDEDTLNPLWPPVSEDKIVYLEIGESPVLKINPWAKRMDLWTKLYSSS